MSRPVRRAAVAGAAALLVALLPIAPASAAGVPSVTITAPAAGPVAGFVTVSVDGTTDGGNAPTSVQLFADTGGGPVSLGSVPCPGTSVAADGCTGDLTWDTTTLPDTAVSLTASLFDDATPGALPLVSTSTSTDVTISNPGASVAITSPTDPASGTVPVLVSGVADSGEVPTSIKLYSGSTLIGSRPCPGTATAADACAVSIPWDTTAFVNGPVKLSASLFTDGSPSAVPVAFSGAVAPAVSNPAASVAITSPSGSATVAGSVPVVASGAADGGSVPTSIKVFAGATLVGAGPCPGTATAANGCAVSISWDTTVLPDGAASLTAELYTDETPGASPAATSGAVATTVANPAPAVTITHPAPGSASGVIAVHVVGTSDGAGTAVGVELYVDNAKVDSVACPGPGPSDCTVDLTWDASTATNAQHHLRARLLYGASSHVDSPDVVVTIDNPAPTVAITAPTAQATVSGATSISVSATSDISSTDFLASIVVRDGSTVIGTVTCAPPSRDCSGSVPWDVTAVAGSRILRAEVVTVGLVHALSAPVTVTVSNPAPSVAITSPTPGATVVGASTVTVSASTDPGLTDYPASIAVSDGSTVIGTVTCTPPSHSCTGSVSWDATSLSGVHTLTAQVTTTRSVSASSAPVTVTVTNPAPTVVVTSPGGEAVVSGTVSVRATGSTDARRSDLPGTFSLLVDGVGQSTATCPTATHDCEVVLTWDASRSVGAHELVVTMTTTSGATATSPSVLVYASSATRVVLGLPKIARAGSAVVVTGRVVAATTGGGVAGVTVTVTRRPVVGAVSSVRVLTGAGGVFTVRYVARSNATVTAVVTRTPWLGTSVRATSIRTAAPMTCTAATRTLAVGAVGRGACAVPGLPAGTGLSLRYFVRGRLATLASGKAKGAAIPFAFGFPARGVYLLRIDLLATKVYVATTSSLLRVVVR